MSCAIIYGVKKKVSAAQNPGLKFDTGKVDYSLVDLDADREFAAVLSFGAVQYEPGNWAFVENASDRYYAAVQRHLRASRRGEVTDPDTGLATLAHALCDVHFLLALELRRHPELGETFGDRFAEALRRAREIRRLRKECEKTGKRGGLKKKKRNP